MIGSNFKVSQNVILDMFKKEFSKVKRFEISVFDHCNYYPCYKYYASRPYYAVPLTTLTGVMKTIAFVEVW